MASIFKPTKESKKYVVEYTDETGRRRKKTAYTDKRESIRLGEKLEETARKVRDGLITRSELTIASCQRQPLGDHINSYHQFLLDADKTAKFADLARNRLRKLFNVAKATSLGKITLEGVQSALSKLGADGWN